MELKENLVRARRAKGLTQEELAARVGVSRQAVSKWETGDALPDVYKLSALSECLGVSLDVLCGREAEPAALEKEKSTPKGKHVPGWACLLALLLCVLGGFWAGSRFAGTPEPKGDQAPQLPDVITVSGLRFSYGETGGIAYEFVPSVVGEGYTYQLTLLGSDGDRKTVDVVCDGGICAGEAFVQWQTEYMAAVVVSCGTDSRAVQLASGLTLGEPGWVTWVPAE